MNQRETAMHVLPGAMDIGRVLALKEPHARHRTYKHENRTLMDVIVKEKYERKPISWGPIRKPAHDDE